MKTEREQFEACFPVPEHVRWSEKTKKYQALLWIGAEDRNPQQGRWEGWQAAAKQYRVADGLAWVVSSGCTCPVLVPLRSMHLKICADCGKEHPWELAPGQQPLIGNNRADRRAAE